MLIEISMKKTNGKKLSLTTATIRQLETDLSPDQLRAVNGGGAGPTDKCSGDIRQTRSCSGTATC